MSKYQALHEKVYTLPNDEQILYEAKTVLTFLSSYIILHTSRGDMTDWPIEGLVDAEDKLAYIENERAKALKAVQEFSEQDKALSDEFAILAEAVFALVKGKDFLEAGNLVQVPISQIREKLVYGGSDNKAIRTIKFDKR